MELQTSTITSKGQLTLPVSLRRHLDLKTGDKIQFFEDEAGNIILKPKTASIHDLLGSLPKPRKKASLKDIENAIAQGAVDWYGRS